MGGLLVPSKSGDRFRKAVMENRDRGSPEHLLVEQVTVDGSVVADVRARLLLLWRACAAVVLPVARTRKALGEVPYE